MREKKKVAAGIRLRHEGTGCGSRMRGLRIAFPQSHGLAGLRLPAALRVAKWSLRTHVVRVLQYTLLPTYCNYPYTAMNWSVLD
jgi:hypothetical protein